MTNPENESGKLTVPDAATEREVMRLWRQVVELDRQHAGRKPPRNGRDAPRER